MPEADASKFVKLDNRCIKFNHIRCKTKIDHTQRITRCSKPGEIGVYSLQCMFHAAWKAKDLVKFELLEVTHKWSQQNPFFIGLITHKVQSTETIHRATPRKQGSMVNVAFERG